MIATITILASSPDGGRAVIALDGLHSGITLTVERVRGVDTSHLTYSGVMRVGPIGEWIADTVPGLILRGTGVHEYELTVEDGTVRGVALSWRKLGAGERRAA